MLSTTAGGVLDIGIAFPLENPRPYRKKKTETLFDLWVKAPKSEPIREPQAQALTRAVLEWTGWSNRKLAKVLACSHPTVAALEQGRSAGLIDGLFGRLCDVHAVAQRLFLIADRDTSQVDRLLMTKLEAGYSAMDLLLERRTAEAYLAVLAVRRPHRVAGMMQGIWPAKPGEATVDLADRSE